MRKKRNIRTTNKELYEKLIMLNISPEVILKGIKPSYAKRMVKKINTKNDIIAMEKVGKYIVLKKKNPIDFNVYYKNVKKYI